MAETVKMEDKKGNTANKVVTWANNITDRRIEVDGGDTIVHYEHVSTDSGGTRIFRAMDASPKPK